MADAGITDGMPFRTYSSIWLPYVALPFFAFLALGLKRFCAEGYLPRIRWLLLVWLGQCTGVGVSLGYHRYFSHKAYSLRKQSKATKPTNEKGINEKGEKEESAEKPEKKPQKKEDGSA